MFSITRPRCPARRRRLIEWAVAPGDARAHELLRSQRGAVVDDGDATRRAGRRSAQVYAQHGCTVRRRARDNDVPRPPSALARGAPRRLTAARRAALTRCDGTWGGVRAPARIGLRAPA